MAYLTRRNAAPGILLLVVGSHVVLLLLLLSLRSTLVTFVPSDSIFYVAVAPPPPPPVVEASVEPVEPARPKAPSLQIPRPPAATVKASAESAANSPPSHDFVPGSDWGSGERASSGSSRQGVRVPNDYAERVKARVVANLVRPAGTTYPKSAKADGTPVYRECTIPYELLVDAEGKVLSFTIERCGDAQLDAAAEAALRKSGPHPPPPNTGAQSYVIYGTANFKSP
jgi:TonB family protein